MTRKQAFSGSRTIGVELFLDEETGLWTDGGAEPLADDLQPIFNRLLVGFDCAELVIDFDYEGWHEAATWDDPSDGEDERDITGFSLRVGCPTEKTIDVVAKADQAVLNSHFQEAVDAAEIDCEPNDEDGDYEYDRRRDRRADRD